jgi:hypothetical protein
MTTTAPLYTAFKSGSKDRVVETTALAVAAWMGIDGAS